MNLSGRTVSEIVEAISANSDPFGDENIHLSNATVTDYGPVDSRVAP